MQSRTARLNRLAWVIGIVAAATAGVAHGAGDSAKRPSARGYVTVDGSRFVDAEGRHLLLHGMNVVDKSVDWTQWPWLNRDSFADLAEWGHNCVRLGFTWASLEPEPGRYSEKCLANIDERIGWAKECGLYVFLDMHQDLYSVKYSDGAPEWATLTDGLPHAADGSVWSDAYFTSPAIQRAFDNFWANKPGPDGVGIQDRYALAWRHLAERYAGDTTVIGYDLMNEPFVGSAAIQGQLLMVSKFAELLRAKEGDGAPSGLEIVEQWGSREGRSRIMTHLADMDIYAPSVDASAPVFQAFERKQLTPMFQRVTNAIREVDSDHIIFLETSMASNMGVHTAIEPVLGPDGRRDPRQAYAPHGYDIVVDTPDLARGSNDRVEFIFRRHGESARRLGMPMIVGEWGAFPARAKGVLPAGRFLVRQYERLLCGDTFWCYVKGLDQAEFFEIIRRPYPAQVAGTLAEYRSEPDTRAFSCVWQEDPQVTAPTRVYLPETYFRGKETVELSPLGAGFEVRPAGEGAKNVWIVIAPTGKAIDRRLSVR